MGTETVMNSSGLCRKSDCSESLAVPLGIIFAATACKDSEEDFFKLLPEGCPCLDTCPDRTDDCPGAEEDLRDSSILDCARLKR